MITVPGWLKNVYEITAEEVTFPSRELLPQIIPGKNRFQFVAPSTSILAVVKFDEIELVVGHAVDEQTLKNALGFGLKSRKFLKILKCEGLSSLRSVDSMIALGNNIIKEQRGLTDDIPVKILVDSEEEDDYNG
jgi:hypothetical protein